MADILFRCSSLGRIMTNPTAAAAKAGEILSVGAKTYIRQLAAQEVFGVEFEISAKVLEKGIRVEADSIALLNRVMGLSLEKNAERRSDGLITGEADLFYPARRKGFDLKSSWSFATFPIVEIDCADADYEWQMRGYMRLWDADEWTVAYALVNTPEDLIGYENHALHFVDHVPEHHRLTTWTIKRDQEKEALIDVKVRAARDYFRQVVAEFERTHAELGAAPWVPAAAAEVAKTTGPADVPADIFA